MADKEREVYEFRGVDNLVYAKVIVDNEKEFTCEAPKMLAGIAEIGKTTSSEINTKFYDNAPKLTVKASGQDEITVSTSAIDLDVLADLTGNDYDPATGLYNECDGVPPYVAIGYRTKDTKGVYRYVWRLKGTFAVPDESAKTEDSSTDSNGQELKYTGIATTHRFERKGLPSRGITLPESDLVDLSTWFDAVQTPDTVTAKAPVSEITE